jgi:hypothetical protein
VIRHAILMIGLFLVFICCLSVIAEETKAEEVLLGEALMEQTGDVWAASEAWFAQDLVQEQLSKSDRKTLSALYKSDTGKALLLVGHARAKAIKAGKTPPPFGKIKGAEMVSVDDAESATETYHVLLTNYLGKMKQSFAEDRKMDDEVWGGTIDEGQELADHMKKLQGNFKQMKDSVIQNIR